MAAPLSSKLDWELANPIWAQSLNPVLANPLSSTSILSNIVLKVGANVINHKLAHMQNGWFLTDVNAVATIFRSAPFNASTLTLTSSAAVTVSIGVF